MSDPHQPDGVDESDAVGSGEPELAEDAESSAVPAGAGFDPSTASVEDLIEVLENTTAARDEYLDALRRNQGDFEKYSKRAAKEVADDAARAVESLVEKLLPVIDACEAAAHHGSEEVAPIHAALLGSLEKEGLERIDPLGREFDPTLHEAVMHEPAGDGETETVVAAVMRAGFSWKGRVIRPAMVTVRG